MRERLTPGALLVIALLLATPVLAGCIGGAEAATAQEQQATADEKAQAWAPDAELVAIMGMEGNFFSHGMASNVAQAACEGDYWDRASEDGNVGDGRSEVWAYMYDSDQEPGIRVIVLDADGSTIQECTSRDDQNAPALGDWAIDSDEATAKAMDASEGLAQGTDKAYYGLAMVLVNDGSYANPVWYIAGGGGDMSGGGGGMAVIDAVTGDVLQAEGGFGNAGDWGSSWDR